VDGQLLGGRYRLGEPLGRGGMATVYRARDTLLHRDVAIKVFASVDLPDRDARRAAEVHLLAGLSHPSLVTVFDAGAGGGPGELADPFAYLVMELVDGQTLRQLLSGGPLSAHETAALGVQLAGALAYIHARGVVHRDVKPANILLSEIAAGRRLAKLTDFGVARLLNGTRLTTEGSTVGTANYLSPEQATGGELTGASDIYSFGLVLLECRTGEVAYPGHGVEAAVTRLHRQPLIPPALGPEWNDLLARMTARDPAARPGADQVADALQRLALAGEPTVASLNMPLAPLAASLAGPTTLPPHRPPAGDAASSDEAPTQFLTPAPAGTSRRRLIPALVGVALLIVAGIVAIALAAGGDGSPTPAASFPRIANAESEPLLALEQAVGSLEPLRSDALAIARAAAVRNRAGMLSGLSTLGRDLTAARAAGTVSDTQAAMITAAMSAVRAALPLAVPSSSARPSPSPSGSRSVPPSASVARTTRPVSRPTSSSATTRPAPKPRSKPKAKPKPKPKPPKKHGPGPHH
jgi:hypothetical protein